MEVKLNQEDKSEAKKEKERILALLLQASRNLVLDYKNTLKHTSGWLTTSMTYAYNKGVNDTIKLLAKEGNNEQSKDS